MVSFAQGPYEIVGVVTSGDGGALPGVNVLVTGTPNGTATDFDGNYKITAIAGDVLEFNYIGFATQTIEVTGQKTINVTLAEDATALADVVVVGYGTRKKSHLTGSIAKIGGDDIAAVQATRVDDALAGKLSGVRIQTQSGEPGADPNIQIRAATSVTGDVGPLVVVNGFPISGSIATINPNDIESLEILKDAASAAIYGSRGAAGVILVTTKSGKQGKPSFSYNTYYSTTRKYVDDLDQLFTAGEWADEVERGVANGTFDLSEIDQDLYDYRLNALKNAPDVLSVEDWLFRDGHTQSHDFSVSGGSESVNYFASLGYQDTDGIAQKQDFERINTRLSVDAKLGDKIKAGVSFNGFTSERQQLPHDQRDLLRAYSISPIYHTEESIAFVQDLDQQAQAIGLAPFDEGYRGTGNINGSVSTLEVGDVVHDWHYGRSGNGIGGTGDAGPAAKLDNQSDRTRTFYGNINSYFDYQIIDGLNIKTTLGGDLNDTRRDQFTGLLADARERTDQTALDQTDLKVYSYVSETTLNFSKVIGDHDIAAVAGFEFQNTYFLGTNLRGTNLPVTEFHNFDRLNPADIVVTERDETRTRRSVFGRINYAYDDRYLLSVSLRRDGDSRFGENEQFETFPAVSIGWNVHNEAFWEPIANAVSTFKPRFSRGSLGTTAFLGSYDSLSLLNPTPTVFGTGFLTPENTANPDLTWQTNTETNYGVDLGFLNNRIKLGVDYYTSNIEDMLIDQPQDVALGNDSGLVNTGDLESRGFEFEITAEVMRTDDFSWSVGGNLSTVDTEIIDLDGLDELPRTVYGGPGGRGPEFRNYVGGEIGEMWGLEVIGEVERRFIKEPTRAIGQGSSEYYVVDQNNDGQINDDDYVKLGSANPDFYWGFNSSMTYKDFDFSFQLQGSHGAEVYNIDDIYFQTQFGGRVQDTFDANDDGIADHNGEFYEETRNAHGALIQDASFVALRNVTIGYTLSNDITSKIGLNSVRLYGAATNLLYLFSDDYTSYNPEGVETNNGGYQGPTTYGYQEGASPIVRSFTVGLNVNF